MDELLASLPLDLSVEELTSIEAFRQKKNTAVLTILFTDIQGFTALSETKGEAYVHELHGHHDRILTSTIEEDHAGVVIKFIGDSVMAVFSEPTAAVEKALRIQKRLADFNAAHPEFVDLQVRIGLHLGQTVVENKVQTDLFGRHVNRASRVESLAAGGHIYLSYSVFDSAKSWLLDHPEYGFVSHGRYILKGIPEPEAIYEVFQTGVARPEAPRGGRKQRSLALPLAALAAVATLGILVVMLTTRQAPVVATVAPQPTPAASEAPTPLPTPAVTTAAQVAAPVSPPEVVFTGMIAREPIVDFHTPLAVAPVPGSDSLKQALTPLTPGRHVVHYEVSNIVRYFAAFEVKPGKSVVAVKFAESYLPNTQVSYEWGEAEAPAPADTRTDDQSYHFYDHKTLARIDRRGQVSVTVKGVSSDQAQARFEVTYAVVLGGKTVAEKAFTVDNPLDQTSHTSPRQVVFEDDYHRYELRTRGWNRNLTVDLEGSFKD